MRVGLVGCGKQKLPFAAPAEDLYTSQLFRARREFVERTCKRWFVVSAKHGLLLPKDMVVPYDFSLRQLSMSGRARWALHIREALRFRLGGLTAHSFEIHAGRLYAEPLVAALEAAGAVVLLPTKGLSVGRQLNYYKVLAS